MGRHFIATTVNSSCPYSRQLSVSCTSGTGIVGVISSVCRHYERPVRPGETRFPGHTIVSKIVRTSFYGRSFASSDEHSAACLEYGWTHHYGRNTSSFVMSRAARRRGIKTTDRRYLDAVKYSAERRAVRGWDRV